MFWENNIVSADGWKIKKFEKICVKHENINHRVGLQHMPILRLWDFLLKVMKFFVSVPNVNPVLVYLLSNRSEICISLFIKKFVLFRYQSNCR